MINGVLFSERVVATGISVWADMATDLKKEWDAASSEIKGHVAAAPWGRGAEGQAFLRALMRTGGPLQMVESGKRTIDEIVKAGPTLRETIGNSVATDQAEAARIKRMLIEI